MPSLICRRLGNYVACVMIRSDCNRFYCHLGTKFTMCRRKQSCHRWWAVSSVLSKRQKGCVTVWIFYCWIGTTGLIIMVVLKSLSICCSSFIGHFTRFLLYFTENCTVIVQNLRALFASVKLWPIRHAWIFLKSWKDTKDFFPCSSILNKNCENYKYHINCEN